MLQGVAVSIGSFAVVNVLDQDSLNELDKKKNSSKARLPQALLVLLVASLGLQYPEVG